LFRIISNLRRIQFTLFFSTGKCLPETRSPVVADVVEVGVASDAVLVEVSIVSADVLVVDAFDVMSTTYTLHTHTH